MEAPPPAPGPRLTRRTFTAGLGALGAGAVLPLAGPALTAEAAPRSAVWARRAAASYTAMRRYLLVRDGNGLYRERWPAPHEGNLYSYEWPFSQAHAATLDLTGMRDAGRRYAADLAEHTRAQQFYWKADGGTTGKPGFASYVVPPLGQGGDFFYDDNEWVGLIDTQKWAMYRDQSALAEAKTIFELVVSGWDDDPDHIPQGGVFWTQAPWSQDRNTVSNMPGAQLGLRLHQITGEQHYLDWALRMYGWTNRYLQRRDGLYHDHLNLQGSVDETIWSYNQGVPVSVNVLLHQVTGQRRYLTEALRIARRARAYFAADGRLHRQPPFFNSIYFKNLLLLEAAVDGFAARPSMARYAEEVWSSTARSRTTGLFRFDQNEETNVIEQAAMVQIFAVLAWPPSRYRLLY